MWGCFRQQTKKLQEEIKKIDSFDSDNLHNTEKLDYFTKLAHSGAFMMLLLEIVKDIGKKVINNIYL